MKEVVKKEVVTDYYGYQVTVAKILKKQKTALKALAVENKEFCRNYIDAHKKMTKSFRYESSKDVYDRILDDLHSHWPEGNYLEIDSHSSVKGHTVCVSGPSWIEFILNLWHDDKIDDEEKCELIDIGLGYL